MDKPQSFYTGVSHQIGKYADAYRVPAGYETVFVSGTQWLVDAADIAAYAPIRYEFLTHEPEFMLGVVSALVWPKLRVEIEVTAALPASG